MKRGGYIVKESIFSECGKYRYVLSRIWDDAKPFAMCIGLNPSTAGRIGKDGEEENDATIRNLIGHLSSLGFGGLKMCNLYAYVSSKPKVLFEIADPLKDNDLWIDTTAHTVQEIIFCWGAFKNIQYRSKQMIKKFPDGKCFGRNKDHSPWHPLAMMYSGIKYGESKLTTY